MQSEVLAESLTQDSFTGLGLQSELLRAVQELGYTNPTEIQGEAIPLALAGKDFIGQAKTGTGKTAAFGLPILQTLKPGHKALILVPTRELALQVSKELRKFAKHLPHKVFAIYGGQSINVQIEGIQRGVDVIVATPGRLMDHMERRTIFLNNVSILVLDEADRMLDMGFRPDIIHILEQLPKHRQTMLFSATMQTEVVDLAKNYMHSTQRIGKSDEVVVEKIRQEYYLVERNRKISLLRTIMHEERVTKGIVFCSTRRQVDFLTRKLEQFRIPVLAIHAGLRQTKRENVMQTFRGGKVRLLIATDVAARGIDIQDVSHVINYDLPQSTDDYVHRIGRTARAGKEGKAITLITSLDAPLFLDLEKALGVKISQRMSPIANQSIQSLDIERIRKEQWIREGQRRFPMRRTFKRREEVRTDGPVPYNIMA